MNVLCVYWVAVILLQAYDTAQDNARRAYRRLDAEHGLTDAAARARRRLAETAADMDQQIPVRRRVAAMFEVRWHFVLRLLLEAARLPSSCAA